MSILNDGMARTRVGRKLRQAGGARRKGSKQNAADGKCPERVRWPEKSEEGGQEMRRMMRGSVDFDEEREELRAGTNRRELKMEMKVAAGDAEDVPAKTKHR